MTSEEGKVTKLNLADINALAGPPPVLRTEDRDLYDRIHAQFMACLQPGDFLEWWLIDGLVVDGWYIKRYRYHQTVSVERWFEQSLEFQVQRLKSQHTRRQAFLGDRAQQMTATPADVAQVVGLEDKVSAVAAEIDEVLKRVPDEIAHNRALEKGITFQEQLDKLIASTTKRFNERLELFEHYREGLGQRLRQAAAEFEILDGAKQDEDVPRQLEAPAIVPSETAVIECEKADSAASSSEEPK